MADKLTQCCRAFTLALARLSCTFLVPAHPGSPGQNPESSKMVVAVVVVAVDWMDGWNLNDFKSN